MMDEFEIRISKTPGGLGSDAYTASFSATDQGCSVRAAARGETRDSARKALASLLRKMSTEILSAVEDLT